MEVGKVFKRVEAKMGIFYREKIFHAGKKIRKNYFAPSEKYACYAPVSPFFFFFCKHNNLSTPSWTKFTWSVNNTAAFFGLDFTQPILQNW